MTDEEKGIWNGGNTRINEKRELEILRGQEDYYDAIDSEKETREELVKREKLMKQESNYKEIQSNHTLSKKPMHELYTNIDYSKKTKVSGMGGHGGPVDAIRRGAKK